MGLEKGSPKYWVCIVKLAKILHDIIGVLDTLFFKNISFLKFGTPHFPSKLPNGRWYVLVIRGVDEGSSHHGSKNNERLFENVNVFKNLSAQSTESNHPQV